MKTLQQFVNEFSESGCAELIQYALDKKESQRLQSKKYQLRVKEAMRLMKLSQHDPNTPLGHRVDLSETK